MRQNFLEALVKLSKVIDRRNDRPFYSSVQLVGKDGFLHMYAAGDEFDIKCLIGEWKGAEFYFSFNPKMAITFIRKIAKNTFKIEYDFDNHTLTLHGDKNQNLVIESSYANMNEDEESFISRFRNFNNNPDTIDTGIPTADFLKATKIIGRFMANETTRYYLNGIFFDGKRNTAVATNGHVLGLYEFGYDIQIPDTDTNEKGAILWRSVIDFVTKEFRPEDQGYETIRMNRDYALIQIKSRNMSYLIETRTINGTYPDYGRVFPDTNDLPMVSFVAGDFREKIGNLASLKSFNMVDIDISAEGAKLVSKADKANFASEIEINEKDSKDFPIVRFDIKYLQNVADIAEGNFLKLWLNNEGPSLFETEENAKVLVMPLRR